MRLTSRVVLAAVCTLVGTACTTDRSFTDPDATAEPRTSAAAVANGFTFLAPLNKSGLPTGTLNTALPVIVDVCPSTGDCTDATRLRRFTTAGSGSRTVRVSDDASGWIVNWRTGDAPAAAAGTYRIVVSVGTVTLGSTQVRVLPVTTPPGGSKDALPAVVLGQTLPIKFWVTQESITATVIGETGGTLQTPDAELVLGIPASALPPNTVVTAEPITDVPAPEGVLPGTAYEFGPSGVTFEEPVYIGIQVDPATIPTNVPREQLRVHRLENGKWVPLPFADFDPETNTVGTWTEHFSTYAVLPAAFTQIAPGDLHACAATPTSAFCWGQNNSGQLGNNSTTSTTTAVPVALPQFPVGNLKRCRKSGGSFTCSTEPVTQPLMVDAIEVGNAHSCVSGREPTPPYAGRAYCWGLNSVGQLANGTNTGSLVPTPSFIGRDIDQVVTGFGHTCAREKSGDVYCAGTTQNGAIGNGSAATCGVPPGYCAAPIKVNLPAAATALRGGFQTSCATLSTAQIWCWGSNRFGMTGDGTTVNPRPPVQSSALFAEIVPGAVHSCGRTAAGGVSCWGGNAVTGSLGRGTFTNILSPPAVIPGLTLASVEAGKGNSARTFSCGLTAQGEAVCWGANNSGQLGIPVAGQTCTQGTAQFDCTSIPTTVPTSLRFSKLRLGLDLTCGLTLNGEVYCWGLNVFGAIGDGTNTNRSEPTRVLMVTPTP